MAVTLKTWGEQLAEVQEAITAVLTSQRYEINGRAVQREDYLSQKLSTEGDVIAGSATTRGSVQVSFE